MKARDYQDIGVSAIFQYFQKKSGNPIVAMPTGTGKSFLIAEFIRRACVTYPGTRVMKLTHVKELIGQNHITLKRVWPSAPSGIFSAGLGKKQIGFPITFGGIGSVAKVHPQAFGRIDLLLIDECHLLSQKETSQYQKVISGLKEINPYLKVVGFTATPYRLGQGRLIDNGIFTDVCFDMTQKDAFSWLLANGYLSMLIPRRTETELDVSGVHTKGGEYVESELQAAVNRGEVTYAALREMIANSEGRRSWLIFATGIEHTENVANMLDSLGVPTTLVHSKLAGGDKERDRRIAAFKAGEYVAMVNNGILTTGFDHPAIDLIGVLRPTQSAALWVQLLGRGTRPVYADGYPLRDAAERLAAIEAGPKQNCLVMDFAGNTKRLGPINDPVLPRKKGEKGGGSAPVKICEACGTYNHASVRFCISCGKEFPKEVKINARAGTEELIAPNTPKPMKVEVFKVDRVTYHRHSKADRPDSLQVSYFCGLRMFREWVCLEHDGYAAKRARDWWRTRSEDEPPETISDALEKLQTLHVPSHLRVHLKAKEADILAHDFTGTAFGGEDYE